MLLLLLLFLFLSLDLSHILLLLHRHLSMSTCASMIWWPYQKWNKPNEKLFIYLYFIFRSIHFNWMELILCVSYVHRVPHICVSHRYSRHINLYIYVICDKYLCAIKWFASRDHQQRRRQQRIVWHWEIIRARTHSLFHTYTPIKAIAVSVWLRIILNIFING